MKKLTFVFLLAMSAALSLFAQHKIFYGYASLSPDGTRIVIGSNKDRADKNHIYIGPANEPDFNKFTKLTDDTCAYTMTAWSPDNRHIAFGKKWGKGAQLCIMDVENKKQTILVENFQNNEPCWSKDGKEILFTSIRRNSWQIFILDIANKTELQLTTDTSVMNTSPSFSPDNKKIVYQIKRGMDFDIFIMDKDGTNSVKLTNGGVNLNPRWSPDGGKIVFTRIIDQNSEIFIMNSDGSGIKNISNHIERDMTPSWHSQKSQLFFKVTGMELIRSLL